MVQSEATKAMRIAVKEIISNFDSSITICDELHVPNTISNRVDIGCYEENDTSCGIELKQCKTDLFSGFGKNYSFSSNYLCVPTKLVGEACRYLNKLGREDVGIIEYQNNSRYKRILPVRISEGKSIANEIFSYYWQKDCKKKYAVWERI